MGAISAEGVPRFSGSCSEINLEEAFTRSRLRPAQRLPVAHELGETSLAFLVRPTLSTATMEDLAHAVKKVLRTTSR